jgi:allophanate hydrolase subunit 2
MSNHLRVVAPGLATTVQDVGRRGFQRLGIPVSGALDATALALANMAVGNPAYTAALECLYQGPTLIVAADQVRAAVAGVNAELDVEFNGQRQLVPTAQSVTLPNGATLQLLAVWLFLP